MNNSGVLVVVSGFSGAGKGTIMKKLVEDYGYALSISATTRKPREGEVNGKEYFFLERDEFEKMIEQNELIEWAEYVGNYYGTPQFYVEKQLAMGEDVLLEIEMQGGMLVKKQYPHAAMIFITTDSAQCLSARLTNRGTEDKATIQKRLYRASEESTYMDQYDYIVINDDLDKAVKEIHRIIQTEHYRVSQNKELIDRMKHELQEFAEGGLNDDK